MKKSNNKFNCVVGDNVEFNDKIIEKVYNRKNLLQRPLIANVDFAAVVLSLKDPSFDYSTLFKNLLWFDMQNIPSVLVINKIDLADEKEIKLLNELKDMFYYKKVFEISIKQNLNISALKDFFRNKTVVLSGISGVGKSSLINELLEEQICIIGEINTKTKKGKNTTIVTKYYEKEDIKIFDTPGYSLIDLPKYKEKKEVENWFYEMNEFKAACKYKDCIHINEPLCGVKGKINEKRYLFYKSIIERKENEKY